MPLAEALLRYNEGHPLAPIEARRSPEGDLVLALSGELEMKASTEIAPLLEAALLVCPSQGKIFLDLRRVGYISSTGVGLLATTMVSAERRSIELVLLDVPSRVRSVMEVLGLISFFKVEDSRV
jgi:anti-anti-sigma factor